jgi:citrate lyase beta subunit
MAKPKEGTYAIETEYGIFDVVAIAKDRKEFEVLSILKNDLLKERQFNHPKQGEVCLASIAAFIIYLDSVCAILDNTNESNITH